MKKLVCILLAILTFILPALAEESPFAPYSLTAPEGAVLEDNEGMQTFVSGMTRVVAMVIPRVPDEDPTEAIIRMMSQFAPDAVLGEDIPMAEGYVGLTAVNTDQFGEGVDQLNVMILSHTGDLLILSGYDMDGNEEAVQSLLDALLSTLTVSGTSLVLTN